MVVRIPSKALVLLCGPSYSGKTTLAKRILQEAPDTTKEIVSNDKCFEEVVARHPSFPEAQEFRRLGYIVSNPSLEFRRVLADYVCDAYVSAIKRSQLVLFDETVHSSSQINSLLAMTTGLVYEHEIVLLKLAIGRSLHCEFYDKSTRSFRPGRDIVLMQGDMFRMEAQLSQTSATSEVPEIEYYITDPRSISLQFV